MALVKNVFTGGKISMDVDERLLKKGEYRYAKNIRIANSEGSDVGAIEKSLSNKELTKLPFFGENVITIGGVADEFEEKLYWLVKSDLGCFIVEYNTVNNVVSLVLEDTRIGDENVLAFDENYLVTGIVLVVDTDNNNRFLIYTDNNTQPKCINIERSKTYGENGFDEEDILLIKKPPIDAPKIVLGTTETEQEKNIEEKFLLFFYRYRYLDNEYSAISPLSEVPFSPKGFEYDFSTSTNESMINAFNEVSIYFNTGDKRVKAIEVGFIESEKSIPYVIDIFYKKKENWLDNKEEYIKYSNHKIKKIISENQLLRLFDAVPLKAKAMDIINNMIVFGNYTENYNLIDNEDNPVYMDFSLASESIEIPINIPAKSCKSNRGLEAAVVYLDKYGRMTTPLTSKNNTVVIDNSKSITKNNLILSINNTAPKWASYYRVFIKQDKTDYDVIVPSLFYNDGSFSYVKLEHSNIDKVDNSSILIIKSDSRGLITDRLIETKVLEAEKKDKGFLGNGEEAGFYIKLSANNFNLSNNDKVEYYHKMYNDSSGWKGYHFPFRNIHTQPLLESPVFYRTSDASLNDLTVLSNYTGDKDRRYVIEIDGNNNGVDTFKWSNDNGATFIEENKLININVDIDLSDGVTIKFENNAGHLVGDYWVISAKALFEPDGDNYTYAFYQPNEKGIRANTRIVINYEEWDDNTLNFEIAKSSSKSYANIEEWYYGDNISEELAKYVDLNRVYFRRGVYGKKGNSTHLKLQDDGIMTLCIKSSREKGNLSRVHGTLKMTYFNNIIIFETKPKEDNTDIYYETGYTYRIQNGLHKGHNENDINQTENSPAVLKLPFFNCYSWGNGFESVKIKDLFNANKLTIKTRPNSPVENYRKNHRIASLTYGKQYDQTLNYNGLNEFNMSELNFKDLDDKYGSIQRIIEYNTDLDVWQEDKVHRVLYGKSTLYNEDGSSNVGKSDLILGTVVPYAGEFGISTNPESLVVYGNYRYWLDPKRGVMLRKGQSGIEIISKNGMRDWFRDYFRNNPKAINICAYDPYYDQVTLGLNKEHTLTFDEKVLGFTSFHSFIPDWMLRLNNRFYSIKAGQLYLHNEEGNGYNNFYGEQFGSEITTIFNDEHSHDKIYKTLIQEGTKPWRADLKTNYTYGHIKAEEFNQRESRWFAHMRKNENPDDLHGVSQGLGTIREVNGLDITVYQIPQIVSVGDEVWQVLDDDTMQQIGIIKDYTDTVITLENSSIPPQENAFIFSKKDPRIEGGEIRGYYMEVSLTDDTNEKNELFAISSEVAKSYL